MAVWYCRAVDAGEVPACEEELQACRRFLAMREEAKTGRSGFVWSDAHVADVCDMIEKLPHVKAFEGTIVLEPVQCWWLAAIFGFREKATGLRWVRGARIWIPRKNGKTTIATGVVIYCTGFEGEPGAEAVISAGSEAQAAIPYGAIRQTLDKDEELRAILGAKDTRDYCEFQKVGAVIALAHSRAKNLDGLNPHVLLQEELHAQDQAVIGVLKTAQGSRQAPLDIGISTAGRDVNAAAFDDWKTCRQVLSGRLKASRLFTVIYAASEEDKERGFDLATLEKLNPLWGVSLNPTSIEEEVFEARKSESKLQEYRRTRLNWWSRAAGNLISIEKWDAVGDLKLKLDVLKGFPMYVGIDLASRADLNAAAFLVKVGGTLYAVGRYWLPQGSERLKDDRFADAFMGWAAPPHHWLRLTPGGFIDYRVILRDIFEVLDGHNIVGVGLDDYQANIMATDIEAAGYRSFIVPKTARALTAATEDLIARVGEPELLQHDGNPVTAWCAGNVVGFWDEKDNVLPKKEKKGSKANIDGMDALIIANAIRLNHEAGNLGEGALKAAEANPYLSRGLVGAV